MMNLAYLWLLKMINDSIFMQFFSHVLKDFSAMELEVIIIRLHSIQSFKLNWSQSELAIIDPKEPKAY